MVIIIFPVGNVAVSGIMVYTIVGSFAANLWLTNDRVVPLCPALLVWQIHGCILINTIGHLVFVCYLMMVCQPFPLTLHPPAESVSLLFLCICAHITELCLFIARWWLLVRSSFVVLWLSWCFWTVLGDVSHFHTIVAHPSLLLTNGLYIIHLSLYWKFLEGLERSLNLKYILGL